MTKEIQPSSEKLIPEQIFTSDELEAQASNDAMLGCPDHEYLEEEFQQSNWPPKKELFSSLRKFISNLRFRLKYPQAFQNLEREAKNRTE